MCGRFVGFRKYEELIRYFPIDESVCSVTVSYNIAPTREVLAIHNRDGKNVLDRFHWGLVPFWAKDRSMGARMINARAETLSEKPSFKHAYKRRRCLIPADGFYEWSGPKGNKQPYFFTLPDKHPFAFAGIWDTWRGKDPSAAAYQSCAIITTAASDSVRDIHHRMPAILLPDVYDAWLDPENTDTNALDAILKQHIATEMVSHPVSNRVNSAGTDEARNINPLKQMNFDFQPGGGK